MLAWTQAVAQKHQGEGGVVWAEATSPVISWRKSNSQYLQGFAVM